MTVNQVTDGEKTLLSRHKQPSDRAELHVNDCEVHVTTSVLLNHVDTESANGSLRPRLGGNQGFRDNLSRDLIRNRDTAKADGNEK